ncbi:unnamed protein product [Paramecium sonneborni]|uniref:Uncharacterized protein n=1 Tax=Paramecium sonneborni TaxID=65129 RepID=A0A8S1RVF4_9CILI|nr:unnamed protein product [Paramecium sonneborni]
MFNTNFNTFFVPQQLLYPYGYQYLIMPQTFSVLNQQHYTLQAQTQILENKSSSELNRSIEDIQKKNFLETESKLDQTSNQEEIKDTHLQTKLEKKIHQKKSQKPNFLVKSTNIQKIMQRLLYLLHVDKETQFMKFWEKQEAKSF